MTNLSGCGKIRLILITICFMVSVVFSIQFVSCDQDSIFAIISNETKPRSARIPGTQTEIVIAKEGQSGSERDYLYVASVNSSIIHKYREGAWETMPAPGGRIFALASDGKILYALSGSDVMNAALYIKEPADTDWSAPVTVDAYSLDSIYCAAGKLFAGGRKGVNYDIFYLDDSDPLNLTLTSISSDGALISGDAFQRAVLKGVVESGGEYYIAAGNNNFTLNNTTHYNGILKWDGTTLTAVKIIDGSSSHNVTGIKEIISGSGDIIAVTSGGYVLKLDGNEFKEQISGPSFTGSISVWKDKLVLLGVHSSSRFGKGYRELTIDFAAFRIPGDNNGSTVANQDQYNGTLARYSVYSIMQVPQNVEDDTLNAGNNYEPVIFAATNSGLHSLRNGEWNLED